MAYVGYRRDNRGKPKEFFKVECSDCGMECEVPFKPTQGKPVLCKDCYNKHRP